MHPAEKRNKTKRIILLMISVTSFCIFLLAVLAMIILPGAEKYATKDSDKIVDIDSIVNELNAALPTMLDQETRFDKAVAHPNEIEFKHTLVNVRRIKMDALKFNAAIRPGIIGAICDHEDNAATSKSGVSFTYSYYDRDNVTITKVTIPPSTCI